MIYTLACILVGVGVNQGLAFVERWLVAFNSMRRQERSVARSLWCLFVVVPVAIAGSVGYAYLGGRAALEWVLR